MAGIWNDGNAVLKDLTAVFEDTRRKMPEPEWKKYCMEVESDGAYEKYAFPTAVPFPRQWVDERVHRAVDVNLTSQLDNNLYELSLEFAGTLLNDSRAYKGLEQMVAEAAAAAFSYQQYLVSQLLVNSHTSGYTAYDSVVFHLATGHYYAGAGNNTINNYLTGTGTTVDVLRTDLAAAIAAMRQYKDDKGKLVNPAMAANAQNLVVVCPPQMEYNFRQVLNSAWYPIAIAGSAASGAPGANVMQGVADLVVDPYLTDANDWFLQYNGTAYRPFVMQTREPLRVETLGFDSEHYRKTGKVLILTRQRMRAGYFAFYRSIRTYN